MAQETEKKFDVFDNLAIKLVWDETYSILIASLLETSLTSRTVLDEVFIVKNMIYMILIFIIHLTQ